MTDPSPMSITIAYPSSPQYTGGVVVLYEYANGLARRGHEVHLVHGPLTPHRIDHLDQLSWFPFHPAVRHHLVDALDDPSLPETDVVFPAGAPARLGLPAIFLQGYQMIAAQLERPAFRHPCLKICVATWLADVGVAWGSPAEQFRYVPMGIDHDLFRVVTPLDDRPVDVAVLYHEHPNKGWEDGLAALETVRDKRPDLRVDVFSIVPPKHPVPDWMRLHLDLDRRHLVTDVYNQAKVFLQPSLVEGFGFTSVESMATGCALVTTDNGGSRDYAIPDETALVVPRGDAPAMAEAVLRLLDDDDLRTGLARAGERYVRRFDWDEGAAILEAHLRDYLRDPAAFQREPSPAPNFLEGFP